MSSPILISGGGIGGLSSALCLLHLGMKPVVLEQAHTLEEIGTGIQIPPNASRILHEIGLKAGLETTASLPQNIDLRQGRTGQLLARLPLRDGRYTAPYYHIHRGDLQTLLYRQLKTLAPEALRLSSRVVEIHQDETQVTVTLESGEQLSGAILIAAEGGHSTTRQRITKQAPPTPTGYTAWRGLFHTDTPFPSAATVWMGKNEHVVSYPVRGRLNVVAVTKEPHIQPKERYKGWVLQNILENAHSTTPWEIFENTPLYSERRIAFLGDTACLQPPFLAQGAAMAIEDAWTLALALHKYSPLEAFMLYKNLREKRSVRVQKTALRHLRVFHAQGYKGSFIHRMLSLTRFFPFLLPRFDWLYEHDITRHL